MYQLITIKFSHYCEKARWALDRAGVAYLERGYMPGLHFPATMHALRRTNIGRADGASTRYSTPLLVKGSLRISDSSSIIEYVDNQYGHDHLYAPDEARELDRRFSERLGPHTRRVAYYFALADRALMSRLADQNVSRAQALLFRGFFPFGRVMLRRALRIDHAGYRRSREVIREVADEVAERLSDGRRYLCGDRFSAADLSFACMFAPAIFPAGYGAVLPRIEDMVSEAQDIVHTFREHRAGRFAARMFEQERQGPVSAG